MSPSKTKQLTRAAIAVFAFLGALSLVAIYRSPQALAQYGLLQHVWYLVLILVGLSVAAVVFLFAETSAIYDGAVLGGRLKLAGPGVVLALVVLGGLFFVPKPSASFDLVVFPRISQGPVRDFSAPDAELTIDFGKDRRKERLGSKGSFRFDGIPANLRGESYVASFKSDRYETLVESPSVKMDEEVQYIEVRSRHTRIYGTVTGDGERPIEGATVVIAGEKTYTDAAGMFDVGPIPANLEEVEVSVVRQGYLTWRGVAVVRGSALMVRLHH